MRGRQTGWVVVGITSFSLVLVLGDDVRAQLNSSFGRNNSQNQFGNSLQNRSPLGQNSGNRGSSFGSSASSMFGNQNRRTNNSFVGRSNNRTGRSNNNRTNQRGSNQRRRFNRSSSGRRGNNRANSSSRNQRQSGRPSGNTANRSRRIIRPRQQIAFDFPKPAATSIATTVRAHFTEFSSQQPTLAGIHIDLNGEGRLTLSGKTASAETKRLAEMLARIEPGVRSIQNEITVTATEPTNP